MGYRALLGRLASAGIDFVVVGGVGAVLQGVPTTTFDLDIVHARDAENRRRLHDLLASLEARYRQHLPKVLTPTLQDLDSDGHLLLVTREGPLDVLGTVTGGRRYEDLVEHSRTMTLGGEHAFRVLDLETIIEIKEKTGRAKDLAQLPVLRETLRKKRSEEA
jgi:hypothetical protein